MGSGAHVSVELIVHCHTSFGMRSQDLAPDLVPNFENGSKWGLKKIFWIYFLPGGGLFGSAKMLLKNLKIGLVLKWAKCNFLVKLGIIGVHNVRFWKNKS